jgi:hypothetical protein
MNAQTDEVGSASILLTSAGMLPAPLAAQRITPNTCYSRFSEPKSVRHNAGQCGQHARGPHFL